jgi:hypothetical protein
MGLLSENRQVLTHENNPGSDTEAFQLSSTGMRPGPARAAGKGDHR